MPQILLARRLALLILVLASSSASGQTGRWARFQAASALADSANAAYQSKRFAEAGPLYESAAAATFASDRPGALYNAACSFALAGQADAAVQALDASVAAGFRDADHMQVDSDLALLHGTPAWPGLVARTAANAEAPARPSSVDSVRIVTEDIPRFWAAYDAALPALAAHDTTAASAVIERDYLDPGTDGLLSYVAVKIGGPRQLAGTLMRYPAYYASIRANTLALPDAAPQIRDGLRALTALYPEAAFPDVYLLIGVLTSGGTSLEPGLTIGSEMYSAAADSPLGEMSPGLQGIIGRADALPHTVVHELVHANQDFSGTWTVLRNVLVEGGADFLSDLALPGRRDAHYTTWGRAHDRAVWTRFMAEKDSLDYSQWTGNSSFRADDWTGDLGYYVGAEICRGYYDAVPDKAQAVRDLLAMRDPAAILAASGVAGRYAGER